MALNPVRNPLGQELACPYKTLAMGLLLATVERLPANMTLKAIFWVCAAAIW